MQETDFNILYHHILSIYFLNVNYANIIVYFTLRQKPICRNSPIFKPRDLKL